MFHALLMACSQLILKDGLWGQGSRGLAKSAACGLQPHEFTPPRCCPNPLLPWSVIDGNGLHDADLPNRFAPKILPTIRSV
jgi:hypothetical protein